MANERHAGRILLSPELFQSLLGIADDVSLAHVEFDHASYQIIVTVEHNEYPRCPEGTTPPYLYVRECQTLLGLVTELRNRGAVMAFDARAFLGEHICQVKPKDGVRCACVCQCCMGECAVATHPADIQHLPILCNALTSHERHKNVTGKIPKAPRPEAPPDPAYAAPGPVNNAFDEPWRGPDPLTDARYTYAEVGDDDEIDGQDLRTEENQRELAGAGVTEAYPGSQTPPSAAPSDPPSIGQTEIRPPSPEADPASQPLAPEAPPRIAPITNRPSTPGGKTDGSQ